MDAALEYIRLGLHHILDYSSWDHLLFVAALTIGFQRRELNKLLLLLTAFTVGHAITLGLTISDHLFLEQKWVELLIPVTILITGLHQLFNLNRKSKKSIWIYIFTIAFGMIHGMGYADTFLSMYGSTEKMWGPLIQFNLGVELGQLIAAFVIYKIGRYIKRFFGISDKSFQAFTAGIVITLAFVLLWINRL